MVRKLSGKDFQKELFYSYLWSELEIALIVFLPEVRNESSV